MMAIILPFQSSEDCGRRGKGLWTAKFLREKGVKAYTVSPLMHFSLNHLVLSQVL